ncbi:hypothetical protein [Pseudonocardia charpentierae]|uniref:Uncharacterized protein n=1 Tax=Pseudonocardia charpentierae TaxID=3075545 RepID=A0ABU2NIV3_9PSEU|nr:hypothetical protein [Pseudonocardia sp. DSM 45834]MDT0353635.1 hypothetical protein [Pseudonocardia sp. DSM 45834]
MIFLVSAPPNDQGLAGWAATDWLALSALIVAVVAVPISILATRRWGNRRARVSISIVSVPLLPDGVREGTIEVSFRDIPVKDPHLVTVEIRNSGPRDLSSDMFDRGESIAIKFDQVFYGLTSSHGGVRTASPAIGTRPPEAIVFVRPALLKRREAWTFNAVTSGPVNVAIEAPLVDTDVVEARPESIGENGSDVVLTFSMFGLSIEYPLSLVRRVGKKNG